MDHYSIEGLGLESNEKVSKIKRWVSMTQSDGID